MNNVKKILALVLVAVMMMALSVSAFAAGTGSITVKNATKGYEYNAYKVFDATYTGSGENVKVSYTTPAANASKLDNTLFGWSTAADADGNISVWKLDTASDSDVIDWVKAHYSDFGGTAIPGSFDETNSTVTFSGLDFGYYYITSGLGSAVTIDSATPSAEVYDKNETTPVDPTKTIVSVDGATQDAVTADAHVGSIVGFKLAGSTNNWIDKDTIRESWSITDTPTNMEIDLSSVVVKFNGTALTVNTDYTATVDATTGKLTINVPMVDSDGNSVFPANLGTSAGLIPIEITYSATITAAAAGTPAKNQIPGSSTEVDTYAFQVAKTDGTDPLPGAQFELWSAKGGETSAKLTFIDNGDGTYTYSETGTVTTLDMTTNTTISIKGLDNGWSYTLKEITVPEGYNQAEDVSIAGSSLTKVTEGMDTSKTSTALFKETVVNKAGAELPSTGGIGTTIFYIVGALLVVGAGVVLVTRRKVDADK